MAKVEVVVFVLLVPKGEAEAALVFPNGELVLFPPKVFVGFPNALFVELASVVLPKANGLLPKFEDAAVEVEEEPNVDEAVVVVPNVGVLEALPKTGVDEDFPNVELFVANVGVVVLNGLADVVAPKGGVFVAFPKEGTDEAVPNVGAADEVAVPKVEVLDVPKPVVPGFDVAEEPPKVNGVLDALLPKAELVVGVVVPNVKEVVEVVLPKAGAEVVVVTPKVDDVVLLPNDGTLLPNEGAEEVVVVPNVEVVDVVVTLKDGVAEVVGVPNDGVPNAGVVELPKVVDVVDPKLGVAIVVVVDPKMGAELAALANVDVVVVTLPGDDDTESGILLGAKLKAEVAEAGAGLDETVVEASEIPKEGADVVGLPNENPLDVSVVLLVVFPNENCGFEVDVLFEFEDAEDLGGVRSNLNPPGFVGAEVVDVFDDDVDVAFGEPNVKVGLAFTELSIVDDAVEDFVLVLSGLNNVLLSELELVLVIVELTDFEGVFVDGNVNILAVDFDVKASVSTGDVGGVGVTAVSLTPNFETPILVLEESGTVTAGTVIDDVVWVVGKSNLKPLVLALDVVSDNDVLAAKLKVTCLSVFDVVFFGGERIPTKGLSILPSGSSSLSSVENCAFAAGFGARDGLLPDNVPTRADRRFFLILSRGMSSKILTGISRVGSSFSVSVTCSSVLVTDSVIVSDAAVSMV